MNQRQRLNRSVVVTLWVLGTMIGSNLLAQEKQFSGPQVGESLSTFKVLEVVSAEQIKDVSLPQSTEDATVLMFMHKLSEPAIGLMMTIEWFVAQHDEVHGHYVMLTDDREKSTAMARRWAARPFFSKSPMSISVDGAEGPGRYGLNRNVDMTVIVAKQNRVLHNFAIRGPNNTDAPDILAAVAKTIGKPAPKYETIRTEMRAERDRRRAKRMQETPLFKLAPNEALGKLMVSMINREQSTEEAVQEIGQAMKEWAGDDRDKQKMLTEYASKVLEGNFRLHRYAREALEEMAKKLPR